MNIPENVRTARLVKVVKATTLVTDLPASTKALLNDLARAVRLLTEADAGKDAITYALNALSAASIEALPDGPMRDAVGKVGASVRQAMS